MNRTTKTTVTALALVSVAWIAAAIWRQSSVRQMADAAVSLSNPNPDIRVPLVPLLLNPFRADPKVYLFENGQVAGQIMLTRQPDE